VAVGTDCRGVMRDREPGVVECRAGPRSGGVAGVAGSGKPGRDVVGIGGVLVIHLVAAITCRRGEVVIAAHMAGCAGRGGGAPVSAQPVVA